MTASPAGQVKMGEHEEFRVFSTANWCMEMSGQKAPPRTEVCGQGPTSDRVWFGVTHSYGLMQTCTI